MHLKRIVPLLLIAMMMFTSVAFAGQQITKDETFYSKDKNFSYKAESVLKKNGKEYHLKDIQYEVVKKPTDVAQTIEIKNLKEEKVPKTKLFDFDGQSARLYLDEKATTYTKNPAEQTYVYQARDPENFAPDQSRQFSNAEGVVVIGKLKDTKKGRLYPKTITIPGRFYGDEGAKYFYFANTGHLWPLNTSAPTWQGYEKDILSYLGLNPNSYKITGGRWISESRSGGTITKTASFSGTQTVCDYTCTYSVADGGDTYTAKAVYSGYLVKATMIYEEEMSLMTKVIYVGAGLLVIAVATAIIIFLLKHKKRKEQ